MKHMKQEPTGERLQIGISGFDLASVGGVPKSRTTLVSGIAGSAKTALAVQFLAEGITRSNENGVFVTFEEPPEKIRKHMMGFGWDLQRWEEEGQWAFVDASPEPGQETVLVGDFDLGALLARIEHAVQTVSAQRVSINSLEAIFTQFADSNLVRRELFRIASGIKKLGVTVLMTAELTQEYREIARHDVQRFVADNVIILRDIPHDEKRPRTLAVLKSGQPSIKRENTP